MSDASLMAAQFGCDQRVFWRNPMYVFFTVVQPLIFLVLFVEVFGNETTNVGGSEIQLSTYYVPAILSMAVVTATFFNLTIALTRMREAGILKRLRGTPLPPWVFLAARVGTSLVVTALLVVLVMLIGHVAYGVALPTHTLPGVLLSLVVGAAAFSCLGFALTSFVRSVDAAAPTTNVIMLPLLFISGVFIPSDQIPAGMQHFADVFPLKHLFEALLTGFDPATTGAGIAWQDLAIIAAWGVLGALVALRRFRWTPRGAGG